MMMEVVFIIMCYNPFKSHFLQIILWTLSSQLRLQPLYILFDRLPANNMMGVVFIIIRHNTSTYCLTRPAGRLIVAGFVL